MVSATVQGGPEVGAEWAPLEVDLVDAHAHVDSDRLGAPVEVVLADAARAGVRAIVMAGVDPAGWAAQRALAARFTHAAPDGAAPTSPWPSLHPVFGVHPQLVPELDLPTLEAQLAELETVLALHRPVGLGETGLDRLTEAATAAMPLQERAFRAQLRLARRFELPVVLHLLRADERALAILREEGLPAAGGVVHSFSGAADFALALVKLGLHISFAGTLTFPQSRRLRDAAARVPADRLLIETDTPDQPPIPHRGEPNRPALLPLVAASLAEVRGISTPAAMALCAANARRLFGLPPG